MSERPQGWVSLAAMLKRLKGETSVVSKAETAVSPDPIYKELRKLGKTQFKANTLAEAQIVQQEATFSQLEAAQVQLDKALTTLRELRHAETNQKTLLALLPALDGLEQAMASGEHYLTKRDRAAALPNKTPKQAQLVSPADRAMLAGWLSGLRLVHERLQAVLLAGGVEPIATVGHLFDPFCHKAMATTAEVTNSDWVPNTIVAEERRGYRTETAVLRFAEVIVYKP